MWSRVGEDSVYEINLELSALTDTCVERRKENQAMVMTTDDQADFENAHMLP